LSIDYLDREPAHRHTSECCQCELKQSSWLSPAA
jgi:hypothetical protein